METTKQVSEAAITFDNDGKDEHPDIKESVHEKRNRHQTNLFTLHSLIMIVKTRNGTARYCQNMRQKHQILRDLIAKVSQILKQFMRSVQRTSIS